MKRKTRSVSGAISYLRRPYKLSFLDEKPWVYKLQVVRGNVIKDDEIVAYAAQAAHIPETAIQMAKTALFDAINFYVTQGMGVQVPGLGSFAPVTRVKVAQTEEECTADTIKQRIIRFYPFEEVAKLGRRDNINFVENETLTNMAVGLVWQSGKPAEQTYLCNYRGKVALFDGKAYSKEQAFVTPEGVDVKEDCVHVAKQGTAGGVTTWVYGTKFYHSSGIGGSERITDLPAWA